MQGLCLVLITGRRGQLLLWLGFVPVYSFCFVVLLKRDLCGGPRTCYVGQAGMELAAIFLPLPPAFWDYKHAAQALHFLLISIYLCARERHSRPKEVRGQLAGAGSFLLPCEPQGPNSGG